MRPIEAGDLATLDFTKAAAAEALAWRNLLPPEPWLGVVAKYPELFGDYVRTRLEAGMANAPVVVARARKAHQQTRPVPVVGIPERIAYRALSSRVLADIASVDRSSEAYARFVAGPIEAAYQGKRFLRVSDAVYQYVIESDITAFYEYVDHARLLAELQLRTSEVGPPQLLVELLTEVQGRSFGLPQLLDPSDELSEVYARIVERELQRSGIEAWRYNDDFRLAARTYDEAQANLEALAQVASTVGLVLNERKTRVVKFFNYFWKNWIESPTEGDVEFKPELIKAEGVYGELDDDGLAELAKESFERLDQPAGSPTHLDARDLSAEDSRLLGRAIAISTKQANSVGLKHVSTLYEYAPHLTHRLGPYLVALNVKAVDVGPTWDALVGRGQFFNAWQRVWLVYVARVCGLLSDPARQGWVQTQRTEGDALLRAEATLALAPFKLASFDDIDRAVRSEPEALLPWYALAAKAIPNVNAKRLEALKESHRLVELLLHKPEKKPKS
ncbi:hypothetical protein GCM10023340_32970 [Nocardioides marinquilinus]|uniref:Reverse transcriptase domain-containing protein n=1 Tax=Nocardioides marinquilinus TaxID=1210400 RepID=A0ABP9PYX6_9ACTN